ncbi:MAG: NAD(P)H-binding protein [Deltaproteobacteria bacterium]|nr:NAD(P)H-binding protein [Deltaproteobacteria bacterium]
MKKKAIILGATGLVGRNLVKLLLDDDRYEGVTVFVRRSTGSLHPKLTEHSVDFDNPGPWEALVTGEDLFSCLGTTIKKAGSKDAQYTIDYTYQYRTAKAAAENGVTTYVLVSSSGANPHSRIFYSRIKGELDRHVKGLPFQTVCILKPSVLMGEREEKRTGESLGVFLGKILIPLIPPLKKYRPIPAETVAKAMIKAANDPDRQAISEYELEEIFVLADK